MRRFLILFAVGMLTVTSLQAAETVRVCVPASMTDAMKELIVRFSASGGHAAIIPNYGPSGTLAKQIAEGAPADLFISANQQWMTSLRDAQQIDPASETLLAANTLVFVGRNTPAVTRIEDIVGLKQIAIGNPKSVPAGAYAVEAMEKAGIYQQLTERRQLVLAKDARQSLVYADRGETDGAFVYATDALLASQAVLLFEVPQSLYQKITYPVALTVNGAQNAAAKAFLAFLTGPDAMHILHAYGFSAAD